MEKMKMKEFKLFVVNTFNVDRAMMLITHYLKNKEEECEKQAKRKWT